MKVLIITDSASASYKLVKADIINFISNLKDDYNVYSVELEELNMEQVSKADSIMLVSDFEGLGQKDHKLKFDFFDEISKITPIVLISTHSLTGYGNHIKSFYNITNLQQPIVRGNKQSKNLKEYIEDIKEYNDEDYFSNYTDDDSLSFTILDLPLNFLSDSSSGGQVKAVKGWLNDDMPQEFYINEIHLHKKTFSHYPERDKESAMASIYGNMGPTSRDFISTLDSTFSYDNLIYSEVPNSQLMRVFSLRLVDVLDDGRLKFKESVKDAIEQISYEESKERQKREEDIEIHLNNKRFIELDLFEKFGDITFSSNHHRRRLKQGKDYILFKYVNEFDANVKVWLFYTKSGKFDYMYEIK